MKENKLKELVKELFDMFDVVEVSNSGREFHPTGIQTCRVQHQIRLEKIIPEIKKILDKK